MFHSCSFEKAWAPTSKPAFGAAFTKKHLQVITPYIAIFKMRGNIVAQVKLELQVSSGIQKWKFSSFFKPLALKILTFSKFFRNYFVVLADVIILISWSSPFLSDYHDLKVKSAIIPCSEFLNNALFLEGPKNIDVS